MIFEELSHSVEYSVVKRPLNFGSPKGSLYVRTNDACSVALVHAGRTHRALRKFPRFSGQDKIYTLMIVKQSRTLWHVYKDADGHERKDVRMNETEYVVNGERGSEAAQERPAQ